MDEEANTIRLDLPATYAALHVLGACLEAVVGWVDGIPERDIMVYNIQLAVHEIAVNIVNHGYAGRSGERIAIAICLIPETRQLVVELRDTGIIFEPSQVQEPNLDQLQEHGYGLFLARSLLDEVLYTPEQHGNYWRLTKTL